jgi:hypothetical protein
MRMLRPVLGLLAAAAVVVAVDRWASSDDSGPVTLLVLAAVSAVAGFLWPRRAWLSALVVGGSLAVANIVYVTVGPARPHPIEPHGVGGAATLFVLILPAAVAAYLGAGARRLLTDGTRTRS